MSVAVVSSIIGGYDSIKPIPKSNEVDYFIFLDDHYSSVDVPEPWNPVWSINPHNISSRLLAKKHKLLTHRYMDKYDTYFWIDGSVEFIENNSVKLMLDEHGDNQLSMFKHPVRDCIFDEGEISKTMKKYQSQNIDAQLGEYLLMGHPYNWGLWASGVFIRQNTVEMNNFFEFWMNENRRWTYQDQLSLSVALKKFGLKPNEFSYSIWDNPWFILNAHESDE